MKPEQVPESTEGTESGGGRAKVRVLLENMLDDVGVDFHSKSAGSRRFRGWLAGGGSPDWLLR